ncbi:MAG TPA: VOC family protein [Thermoplasmata archaeon]|nr:VOC family protein [Thermoplasmata archaeon]
MSELGGSGARVAFTNPQVNLYAGDIEGSLRFYCDVLGFTETFRTPKEGLPAHVELQLGAFKLGLATFEALKRDHGILTSRGPPRVEVVLFTDDVDGAYGWTTSKGGRPLSPPHDFGGYVHSARVADPDGNPVGFTTRLPVKTTADPAAPPTFKNHLFNVYTRDIEKSLQFYRDLVGFTETFRTPKKGPPDHVELELGPLNLAVSTLEALKRDHGFSGGGGPPRAEVVLWVADVDAAYAWMSTKGAPSLSPPHNFAGVLRATWVGDPDGNPVQMVARPGHP